MKVNLDEIRSHMSSCIVMDCVECLLRVSGGFSGGLLPFVPVIRQKRYAPLGYAYNQGVIAKMS